VLLLRIPHLHPPRAPDAAVRHVPVPADLIGGVDDHDALPQLVCTQPRQLPNRCRLPDPRAPQEQDGRPAADQVAHQFRAAGDRAPDAAGEADDLAGAVAHGADAVEGGVDAGAVVAAKVADLVHGWESVGGGEVR